MADEIQKILQDHDADPNSGFLPAQEPLGRLPAEFDAWESVVGVLPELLKEKKLRERVNTIPLLDASHLHGNPQLRRAKLVLSLLVHGYVWQGGEADAASVIPENLAKPFAHVCTTLGFPLVLINADIALWNWKLINPAEGPHLDNIEKKNGFLSIYDEDWFYLVTVGVEHAGAPSVVKMLRCQQLAKEIVASPASSAAAVSEMKSLLAEIASLISQCDKVLARMHEKCEPAKFYTQIRPWLAGWKSNKSLPDGVVFTGAFDNKPQQFYGGSAAQSSLIQSWDAAFGVQHKDHATQYLLAMRQYMPPKHRALVELLASASPSIKDAVTGSGDADLVAAFNACLSAIESFRSTHINIVGRYIVAQSTKREGEEQGTGGTSIMPLLRTARQETRDNRVPDGKPQH